MPANAQDLNSHLWEDRLLLVLAEDATDENFQNQLKILRENSKGLEERKLVVYQILPGKFKKGLKEETQWQQNKDLYKKYKPGNSNFQIILVGLDGGQKLKESEVLPVQTIFNTIDAMPMRQAEIRKKGSK